ncbi:hypothetical protein GCM10011390_10840 [Aureimonas endophytica]|uniref:DUF6456 domain-containing protein n=1 Tax=Aureimonas endophytica TaxID=2027858 RepID=A0A916ZF24_9HYPH|nr:hypothetical protein GCM10011390_10840 [Aureimonas endophytica]
MNATPGFNENESPLARLATRRGPDGQPFLAPAEAMAGERLRADFTRGGLMPSVTQRWDGTPRAGKGMAGGAGDLALSALDARRRVDAALHAVGPELADILLDICCFLKGLELVERERRWPARSAKLLLKAALGALARHYGFERQAEAGNSRIRRWAAPDAKPKGPSSL